MIRRWTGQAPCILVIEDLDRMLKSIAVLAFLNLIDGAMRSRRPAACCCLLRRITPSDWIPP